MSTQNNRWTPASWRDFPIRQVPHYEEQQALQSVERELNRLPPLVFAGECEQLKQELASCVDGKAFVLQGGDCAESFLEFNANLIRDTYRVLLQMAVVLTFAGLKPIVKIGRLAGQFAKPRSEEFEKRDGIQLPSYRGDIINGTDFTETGRTPAPERMIMAYNQSAATLNLLRAFSAGGFADLHKIHQWTLDFTSRGKAAPRFHEMAGRIQECVAFMEACGITSEKVPQLKGTNLYTSHESLLLCYEEALTRQDSLSGHWYDCSAHFLWVGDRTRYLDSAHIEFLRGIKNPIGIKCGPGTDVEELKKLIGILNPDNEKGRITLIIRMGYEQIEEAFPPILRAITREGFHVVWSSDPMHGNIEKVSGFKTRRVDNILSEIGKFFVLHQAEGTHAGGMHLEMTGKNVTECLGGYDEITHRELEDRYHTHCDPRLNGTQALELAFLVADLLHQNEARLSLVGGTSSNGPEVGDLRTRYQA